MRTAAFWTEARDAVADTGSLLAFRRAAVRGRARRWMPVLWVVFAVVTLASILVPPAIDQSAGQVRDLLPSAFLGFLLIVAGAAISSGGGRELVSREHAVTFPISPATDHLGALVLAPLNISWMVQAWSLLGGTAYVVGFGGLATAMPLVLLWIVLGTALAQVAAWSMEAIRRGPGGVVVSRSILCTLGVLGGLVVVKGWATAVVDALPTSWLAERALDRDLSLAWVVLVVGLLCLVLVTVVIGVWPAALVARRPAREENRMDSSTHQPRPTPASDLRLMVRIDRAGVWRSVPLHRGLIVLALVPGLGALATGMDWGQLVILPGLVGSGVVLLLAVNGWSLDGRGLLWRETLPVEPRAVFAARTVVLAELCLGASVVMLALASLRAGVPSVTEAVAVVAAAVVGAVQVVATSAKWSVRSPYAVDLRSRRATPAPPLVMVGYSAKLSLTTTLTGMTFSALAHLPSWSFTIVIAALFLAWSLNKLRRARAVWEDPPARARVVTTVAS